MKIYVVAYNYDAYWTYYKSKRLKNNVKCIYLGSEHSTLGIRLNKETKLVKLKNWNLNKSSHFRERIYILEATKEK